MIQSQRAAVARTFRALAPLPIFNAVQRLRGLPQERPWRGFAQMQTKTNIAPLIEGRFAEIYERFSGLDPTRTKDSGRYAAYNLCAFAEMCRDVPGDIVCAGISFGAMPR